MMFFTPSRSCGPPDGAARRTMAPHVISTSAAPIPTRAARAFVSISSLSGQAGVVSSIVKATFGPSITIPLTMLRVTMSRPSSGSWTVRRASKTAPSVSVLIRRLDPSAGGGGTRSAGAGPGSQIVARDAARAPRTSLPAAGAARGRDGIRTEAVRRATKPAPRSSGLTGVSARPYDPERYCSAVASVSTREEPRHRRAIRRPVPGWSAGATLRGPEEQRDTRGERHRSPARGCREEVRRRGRRRPRRPRGARRRVLLAPRAVRLRQDHDAPHDRRLRGADVRPHRAARPGRDLAAAVSAERQHRLPELRPLPAPHDLRERRLRPAPQEGQGRRDQAPRRRDAGPRRAGRLREAQADPDLGRPGPADRARPGADQPALRAPPRRAPRGARPQAAQADAARAEADPAGGRDHVHLRDPRPGGGDDDVRSHRRHEPRPLRAAGRPGDALRAPGHALRRGLPRHLEPPARAPSSSGPTATSPCGSTEDVVVRIPAARRRRPPRASRSACGPRRSGMYGARPGDPRRAERPGRDRPRRLVPGRQHPVRRRDPRAAAVSPSTSRTSNGPSTGPSTGRATTSGWRGLPTTRSRSPRPPAAPEAEE